MRSGIVCFLALALFGLSACTQQPNENIREIAAGSEVKEHVAQAQANLHQMTNENLPLVAKSGLLELYYDAQTSGVMVKENAAGQTWLSLPLAQPDRQEQKAAVVTAKIRQGDQIYYLNSQDNAVAFGTISSEMLPETGTAANADAVQRLTCTYQLFTDLVTSQKEQLVDTDIAFRVTVEYRLEDGCLFVKTDYENLSKNPNAILEELGILEYFGAYAHNQQGYFMYVPDGPGAAMHTGEVDQTFQPMTFAVYGQDPNQERVEGVIDAQIPAYGMWHSKGGFVALVTQGDALAQIRCDRSREGNDLNYVGPAFNITPVAPSEEGMLYAAAQPYDGDIELCMRFVSGSKSDYNAMASAVREQLIRNRVLSNRVQENAENLPINITLTMTRPSTWFTLGSWAPQRLETLTTFEQAEEIVQRLKGKGVDNVNLRLVGAFSAGSGGKDSAKADLLSRLGGQRRYQTLQDYVNLQNMCLYPDVGLFTLGSSTRNAAQRVTGVPLTNMMDVQRGGQTQPVSLRALAQMEKATASDILPMLYQLGASGVSLQDAGTLLYADYAPTGYNRQAAKAEVVAQVAPFATNRNLMVETGNTYMLRSVNTVLDSPLTVSREETSAYRSIPFLPIVLHGILDYSGHPFNLSQDSKQAMLRSIEYGALPYYVWTYENTQGETEETDILQYEQWLQDASNYYVQANAALQGLQGARIVAHSQVANQVFCTEYDNGSKVYVNYSVADVAVGGITIKAQYFVRTN